ncbi:hypothetical protein PR048_022627 [Dryococelus australis]|uniref:Uncharacterized protein n=1 Tax=Dryococelus australis TaxID=614101 RepID=A0ABQ9H1H6_9NEOP|nr:hypothetical protein PR048_022627 [Dryococelus australis]
MECNTPYDKAIILSSSEIKLRVEFSQSQWELMMNVINIMNIFDHATHLQLVHPTLLLQK